MQADDGGSSMAAATADPGRRPSSSLTPAIVALGAALSIQFGANVTQIAFGLATDTAYQPPYSIARMSLVQSDLRIIRKAAEGYVAGAQDHDAVRQYARSHDPWTRRFPGTPIVYQLLALVNLLPERGLHLLWLFAVPACVAVSLLLATRLLVPIPGSEGRWVLLLTLLTLFGSTPLLFQMERGNVDWIAFTLYMIALAGLSRGNSYGSGMLLGMATVVKLYPGFLLPCLLLSRRFKAVLAALGTMLAVVVVTGPVNNWQWIKALTEDRVVSFGLHPANAGLANLIGTLGLSENATIARLSYATFLLLVVTFLAVAFVRQRRAPIDIGRIGLISIPFMFLMPLTHWAYALFALVALLPLLCALYREREDLRALVLAVSALIGVTQAPFVALRCFAVGLSIVMPVYSICVLCLALLSIWLVARGACDAPRATSAVSV
jgi:hypothetical protein